MGEGQRRWVHGKVKPMGFEPKSKLKPMNWEPTPIRPKRLLLYALVMVWSMACTMIAVWLADV